MHDFSAAIAAVHRSFARKLRDAPEFSHILQGVYDAVPSRSPMPYIVFINHQIDNWGAKEHPGRELHLSLTTFDKRGSIARLLSLSALIEAKMAEDFTTGNDWPSTFSIVSQSFVRTRIVKPDEGPWSALTICRFRIFSYPLDN